MFFWILVTIAIIQIVISIYKCNQMDKVIDMIEDEKYGRIVKRGREKNENKKK